MNEATEELQVDPEQIGYVQVVAWGNRLGLTVMLVGFVGYLSGLLPARIPPETLLEVWSLPLPEFLVQTQSSIGWDWLQYLENGDTLALLGIALLGGVTLAGYLLLLVRFLGERKWRQLGMAVAEIALIVMVAANWIGAGH
ncbi:MAG TPA: hypothetical protein EYM25_00610 [Deltaproteobacteria bacterium]|nr:hypothetical protein [Deltaproteobacteria bacterium]